MPTSERTATLARKLGLTLSTLDDQAPLDLTVDGADEADRNLDLIKGGGGMPLREKIVAALSPEKMIVIAGLVKLVPRLGKFPLPVEVVEFGHKAIAGQSRRGPRRDRLQADQNRSAPDRQRAFLATEEAVQSDL